LCHIAVSVR